MPRQGCGAAVPGRRGASDCFCRQAMALAPESARLRVSMPPTGAAPPARASERQMALRASDRQRVALLFAAAPRVDAIEVQAAVEPFGGQVAHAAQDRCACAFTHRAGDNPGERALAAAEGAARRAARSARHPRRRYGDGQAASDRRSSAARSRVHRRDALPEGERRDESRADGRRPHAVPHGGVRAVALGPITSCSWRRPMTPIGRITRTVTQDASAPLVGREDPLRELIGDARLAMSERRPRVASLLAEPGSARRASPSSSRTGSGSACQARRSSSFARGSRSATIPTRRSPSSFAGAPNCPPIARPTAVARFFAEKLGAIGKDAYAAPRWCSAGSRRSPGRAGAARRAGRARAERGQGGHGGPAPAGRQITRSPVMLDDAHWATTPCSTRSSRPPSTISRSGSCAFARPAFAESAPGLGAARRPRQGLALGPLDRRQRRRALPHISCVRRPTCPNR